MNARHNRPVLPPKSGPQTLRAGFNPQLWGRLLGGSLLVCWLSGLALWVAPWVIEPDPFSAFGNPIAHWGHQFHLASGGVVSVGLGALWVRHAAPAMAQGAGRSGRWLGVSLAALVGSGFLMLLHLPLELSLLVRWTHQGFTWALPVLLGAHLYAKLRR